jgi:dTDP-4-amino-4,6-dideoxygalactose transaminase
VEIPSWPQPTERESELLRTVLDSPQWGGFHPFVAEFEESFAAYQHCDYGISAFNGTVTLELALAVLGIGAGDEVIVPSVSFVSTATAVSRAGAVPVFVDIEPYSFNIDPDRAAEAITPRTRAIIAVHFGGTLADVDSLVRLTAKHGIVLIEDAAHAHGSEWNHRRAGSFGICGSFSFQNGKVLCAGEGGMLVTNDRDFADKAKAFANQGRKPGESYHKHFTLGTNFRMTGFQAAVLIAQFESLPEQIARRMENAALLKTLLADRPKLIWQKQPEQVTQNSFYLLPARLEDATINRDEFCKALDAGQVPCAPFYPFPLYRNPLYQQESPCRALPCPNAEAYVKNAFWLPHRVLLAEKATVLEVAQTIRSTLEVSQASGI